MNNPLQSAGAQSEKPPKFAPLWTSAFITGLWLQRSPIRDPSTRGESIYYGGRQEALISGVNVELTNNRTLARRPGSSIYSTAPISEAVNSFYAFKSFTTNTETIQVIVDGITKIYWVTPTTLTTIFTKSLGAGQASLFGINNTLYIGDGVDQVAWPGSGPTRNWGIAQYQGPTSTSAYAGSAADIATPASGNVTDPAGTGASVSAGFTPWSNPTSISVNDGAYASNNILAAFGVSDYLQATAFGFAVPATATIVGIYAQAITRGNIAGDLSDASVLLMKAGVAGGTDHANGNPWNTTSSFQNYGNATDLWGQAWTPADINSANFGLQFQAASNDPSHTRTAFVDFIQITVYYTVPAGTVWTSVANMQGAPDAVYASILLQPGGPNLKSDVANLTTYGFNLPSTQTIGGITVKITGHVSPATDPITITAILLQNGSQVGTSKTGFIATAGDTVLTLGSSTQLWNALWSPALVSTTGFGVAIQATPNATNETVSIDAVQIILQLTGAPTVTLTTGSLTATTGYKYVLAYGNSVSGAVGPASEPSNLVKPTNQGMSIPLLASTDPQVNQIYVFRTTDGGATYLNIPTSPYQNIAQTVIDNAPDSALDTLALADLTGLNTPPPVGIGGMVFHMGRLWGFVNNVLYYAVGPDLGNVLGNPYEGWPPANFFTLPSKISKLIPTSVGLLVLTVSDIYIVYGNASALAAATGVSGLSVFYVAPFVQQVGLLNQFAADVNGTTIYMMTADGQGLSLDPSSGISEIGFPIGIPNVAYPTDPSLGSYNPANTYVTWHVAGSVDKAVYYSDGSTGWFRCNTAQPPEGGFVWSPKANIGGGCKAVQSIETTPGVRQLLLGPSNVIGGYIRFRDLTVFADFTNPITRNTYASNFIMGSIVLAYPGQVAEIDFITCDYNRVGTSPLVSVLLDEISGPMQNISGYVHSDPPSLYGTTLNPVTLYANRYDFKQSVSGSVPLPDYCRHLQIEVDFGGTDLFKNELFSLTIYGAYHTEN